MQSEYAYRLPQSVQGLLAKIESHSGVEVEIVASPRTAGPNDPNPFGPSCLVDEQRATVQIYSPDHFDPQGITHELLHIERYWCEGIVQVLPKHITTDNIKITSAIENTLEHLVIVPKEAKYEFERYSHWNRTAESTWSRYPWADMTNPWARRKNCLLGWLTVSNLVSDDAVRKHAEDCIRREGHSEAAIKLQRNIRTSIKSKAKMIAHVVKAIDIPVSDVELIQFDIRRRKRHSAPLPR